MGKLEEDGFLLTDLEVVIRTEVDDNIVDQEVDVYAKTFIIEGIPITGYFVVPQGETLLDIEPIELDMINNFIYTYSIDKLYINDHGFYKQVFKYTIFRNYKEFCSGTFNDITTTERNLHSVLERLHTKRNRVDFRLKNFREKLVGEVFNVNNIGFEVLEYIEKKNQIRVRTLKDNSEAILDAFIVNE